MTHRQTLREAQGAVVEVVWGDAISHDDWLRERGIVKKAKPCTTRTVGYVTHVSSTAVAVSCTTNALKRHGGTYVIPLGMIESVKVLKK